MRRHTGLCYDSCNNDAKTGEIYLNLRDTINGRKTPEVGRGRNGPWQVWSHLHSLSEFTFPEMKMSCVFRFFSWGNFVIASVGVSHN